MADVVEEEGDNKAFVWLIKDSTRRKQPTKMRCLKQAKRETVNKGNVKRRNETEGSRSESKIDSKSKMANTKKKDKNEGEKTYHVERNLEDWKAPRMPKRLLIRIKDSEKQVVVAQTNRKKLMNQHGEWVLYTELSKTKSQANWRQLDILWCSEDRHDQKLKFMGLTIAWYTKNAMQNQHKVVASSSAAPTNQMNDISEFGCVFNQNQKSPKQDGCTNREWAVERPHPIVAWRVKRDHSPSRKQTRLMDNKRVLRYAKKSRFRNEGRQIVSQWKKCNNFRLFRSLFMGLFAIDHETLTTAHISKSIKKQSKAKEQHKSIEIIAAKQTCSGWRGWQIARQKSTCNGCGCASIRCGCGWGRNMNGKRTVTTAAEKRLIIEAVPGDVHILDLQQKTISWHSVRQMNSTSMRISTKKKDFKNFMGLTTMSTVRITNTTKWQRSEFRNKLKFRERGTDPLQINENDSRQIDHETISGTRAAGWSRAKMSLAKN